MPTLRSIIWTFSTHDKAMLFFLIHRHYCSFFRHVSWLSIQRYQKHKENGWESTHKAKKKLPNGNMGRKGGYEQKVRLINTHPAMDRRHVKMSSSCKHWVHHNLAIPAGVVRIEKLRCRMSQEPGWGRGKIRFLWLSVPLMHARTYTIISAMDWTQGAMHTTELHL